MNANNLPNNLVIVKRHLVSDLLTRSLRYLNQVRGGRTQTAQLMQMLPYFRDAVELATNRKFLVPAPEFVNLGELTSERRQFTWGLGSPDINHAYPDTIHTLFFSEGDLQLYNSEGQRIGEPGSTGGEAGGIWYHLMPMEASELASSTQYVGGGIPRRYYLQRSTPYHILILDSEPYASSRTLYAVATFPIALPEDDAIALNSHLRLQTGHSTYLWSKTALLAAREYGQSSDVINSLQEINAEAMIGIEDRNYEVETRAADNFDCLGKYNSLDYPGGGPRSVARGLSLRY